MMNNMIIRNVTALGFSVKSGFFCERLRRCVFNNLRRHPLSSLIVMLLLPLREKRKNLEEFQTQTREAGLPRKKRFSEI